MIKEYKIYTIKEILDIIDEKNIDNFLIDFNNFIKFRLKLKELEKNAIKIETVDYFNWIDDNKNETHIKINKIKN